jgi:hypothetical protein
VLFCLTPSLVARFGEFGSICCLADALAEREPGPEQLRQRGTHELPWTSTC